MDSPAEAAVDQGGPDYHRWMMGLLSSAPSIHGYRRLRPDQYERRARRPRRSVKIARFSGGSGQNGSGGRKRRMLGGGGLRLRARLRLCMRWMSPMARALARLRDAYVNMMLSLAASSRTGGNGMAALATFSYQNPGPDLPFGLRPLKEYHPSVILAAHRQLASSLPPTPATA